jgi:hypothetical protein
MQSLKPLHLSDKFYINPLLAVWLSCLFKNILKILFLFHLGRWELTVVYLLVVEYLNLFELVGMLIKT